MPFEKSRNEFWLSQLEDHLNRERYSVVTVQQSRIICREFLSCLSKREIALEAARPTDIAHYLRYALRRYQGRHQRCPVSLNAPKSLQWWRYSHTTSILRLLRLVHGHWPPPPLARTPAEAFQQELCKQYERWMTDVRGLSLATRVDRSAEARRFLCWLGERGSRQGLQNLGAPDIDAYMMQRAKSLRRTTLKTRAGSLRSLLRYLHSTGRLGLKPSAAIIIPRLYAFESIPSALRPDEIRVLIEMMRKDRSPKGLRDFAILILLASYGLRAGEITALRLEDVGWRSEILRIRHSKRGGYSELPLLPRVGNSILDYLRKGRPQTPAREIFVRTCAPYRAFRSGSCLHRLISLRFQAAGIEPQGRHGPHAFRHARAVSMLHAGVPLKRIGDVLGHRSANSTSAYLKLASEDLRAVALEIPAEVNA